MKKLERQEAARREVLLGGLAAALLFAACGGGSAGGDAGLDGGGFPCALPQGRTFVVDEALGDPSLGHDLDGDGEIDNAIAALPAEVLGNINDALLGSIRAGFVLILPVFVESMDGDPPEGHFFVGVDADGDGDDSFSGEGDFLVYESLFDPDCRSRVEVDAIAPKEDEAGNLTGYAIETARWDVSLPIGAGSFELRDAIVDVTFAGGGFEANVGGVLDSCTLDSLPYLFGTASTLERVLEGGLQANYDVDGDGLETIEIDEESLEVVRCVDASDRDGDGEADVYEGSSCPCRPEIADGYTVGMSMHAVSAELVGVL